MGKAVALRLFRFNPDFRGYVFQQRDAVESGDEMMTDRMKHEVTMNVLAPNGRGNGCLELLGFIAG